MKFISWNVNGFRAVLNKGFREFFDSADADFICIQETKMQAGQADFHPDDYYEFYNYAEKKGYSGTAIFARKALGEPVSVSYGINGEHNNEGRVITLEYPAFWLVCCYVPNAQDGLARIDYRCEFEDAMRSYLMELDKVKPVIYCGDLNVAHNEIDLKNPKSNKGNAGFSDEERGKMTELLDSGFTDSFRYLYPDTVTYSWWSYRFRAREKNIGWRIDYFILSRRLTDKLTDAAIMTDVMGSDHCPVSVTLDI
ncbi:MAG: exodeoxyribonuclease III [Clostridiales bacterium]|nr:exodeoxyribonuclease III [Clostridiales bacterium]